MSDIAQQSLKEPEQVDWDNAFSSSKYTAPPPALGPDGEAIVYFGSVKEATKIDPDQGYLNYQIDLTLVRSGSYDGLRVRTWASTRPFMRKDRETGELTAVKGNPNKLRSFLRSAGLQAKPQTNDQYIASVMAVHGKAIPFTIDWQSYNKDTGEKIKGFLAFPIDPATGNRRS